jgi:hypothetical protein
LIAAISENLMAAFFFDFLDGPRNLVTFLCSPHLMRGPAESGRQNHNKSIKEIYVHEKRYL